MLASVELVGVAACKLHCLAMYIASMLLPNAFI